MVRLPRICLPGIPQHIIQRGNNRQPCFASDEDFATYAHWLDEYARKCEVAIHAWVFMTNHVHLLATPRTEDGISRLMQTLGRHYVRYFNYTYKRSGTLWEGRFKSCVVDEENYLLICQRYIELNPVRANMVVSPVNIAGPATGPTDRADPRNCGPRIAYTKTLVNRSRNVSKCIGHCFVVTLTRN